jgi:hypothetical protein
VESVLSSLVTYRYQITRSLDKLLILVAEGVEQFAEKLRNKRFSVQIEEATDCSGIAHLIAYVRYVEDTTINEDIVFWKPI